MVWRFDRFARRVKQLVLALEEFRSLGIDFVSHRSINSSTPIGKAMFTIIGAMAELERNIIRERVIAGMDTPGETEPSPGKPWAGRKRFLTAMKSSNTGRRDYGGDRSSSKFAGVAARPYGGPTKSGRLHKLRSMGMQIQTRTPLWIGHLCPGESGLHLGGCADQQLARIACLKSAWEVLITLHSNWCYGNSRSASQSA